MSFPGPGHRYDLIVVGAGLSGSEAAFACASAGRDVLLVTTSLDTVYNLVGDGATLEPPPGTLMARLVGEAGYIGTWELHRRAKYALEAQPGVHLLQSSVSSLLVRGGAVQGVTTWEGVDRLAPKVVLCVGSFLGARLTVGALTEAAGRLSEMAYDDLYESLEELGFEMETVTLEASPSSGSLPYTVTCKRFAPAEWDAVSFALPRLGGLYGVGVCVSGGLPYEEAARLGRALAEKLLG